MAVNEAVKYAEMTDEQIAAIKRRIETFVKSNEFFDKLCNHEKWDRGSKTMKSRRVIKPKVEKSQVVAAAELVAPRPSKIAVETFSHSVDIYRDKISYSAEDVLYGYDDIVKIAGDTLGEIGVQKLDFIKGAPFIASACTASYATSYDATLGKIAIILNKNGAKPWKNGRYLAICSPETLLAIRAELRSASVNMGEPTKEDIDSGIIGHYGRWDFMECPHELLIKNASTHYMVCMGRRPNGQSPIDVAKIEGVEVIHNPLGSGVLLDVDGNYTSDDNKQKGSVAMNINGLGAYVNDDLCVIDVEVSVSTVGASELMESDKTGFASFSPVSPLTVSVKAAADGSAISSPTVVIKEFSSSGDTVSAEASGTHSGKYLLEPGKTYYYSVSKTSYTTQTGTFVAVPGAQTLVFSLVAA